LYLAEFKVDENQIRAALDNLEKMVETIPCTILDHHILRDESWREKTRNVFEKAHKVGRRVLTAAEYLGKEDSLLEATRRKLYVGNQPSKEFEKWMHYSRETKVRIKPPI
jgi:predicted metallo-beta-lactamase superfamily hydrolase